MKIVNLDKVVTGNERIIILGGVEHKMRAPTVKDFIEQMKMGEQLNTLSKQSDVDSAAKVLEITLTTLMKSFPTIKREQFEALSMEQLNKLRELAEDDSEEDASANTGEAKGELG